ISPLRVDHHQTNRLLRVCRRHMAHRTRQHPHAAAYRCALRRRATPLPLRPRTNLAHSEQTVKAEPATPDPTGPIFISYRHSDGIDLAAELAGLLRAAGIPVWRDKDDLPPGDTEHRLTQAISAGISGAVIVTTADIA